MVEELGRRIGGRIRRRSGSWIGRDLPLMGGGTNPNICRAKPDLEASSCGLNDGLAAMTLVALLDDRFCRRRCQHTMFRGRHNSQMKVEMGGRRLRRPKAERQDCRRFRCRLDARSVTTRASGGWESGFLHAKSSGRDLDGRSRRRRMVRPIFPLMGGSGAFGGAAAAYGVAAAGLDRGTDWHNRGAWPAETSWIASSWLS